MHCILPFSLILIVMIFWVDKGCENCFKLGLLHSLMHNLISLCLLSDSWSLTPGCTLRKAKLAFICCLTLKVCPDPGTSREARTQDHWPRMRRCTAFDHLALIIIVMILWVDKGCENYFKLGLLHSLMHNLVSLCLLSDSRSLTPGRTLRKAKLAFICCLTLKVCPDPGTSREARTQDHWP